MEHTIFGVAISGKVPEELRKGVEVIQAQCVVPVLLHVGEYQCDNSSLEKPLPDSDVKPFEEVNNICREREVYEDLQKIRVDVPESVGHSKVRTEPTVGLTESYESYVVKGQDTGRTIKKQGCCVSYRNYDMIYVNDRNSVNKEV